MGVTPKTTPPTDQAELERLARRVGEALRDAGWYVATAESCTGGWISQCLTAIAGSSEWFERGFVTYSNAAKSDMLGVPEETLAAHGAVSQAVAAAMAEGAIRHSRADWTVAVTGIAGPDGGVAGKPVGTVCFGWANRQGEYWVATAHFAGNREAVRAQAVAYALTGLLARLPGEAAGSAVA